MCLQLWNSFVLLRLLDIKQVNGSNAERGHQQAPICTSPAVFGSDVVENPLVSSAEIKHRRKFSPVFPPSINRVKTIINDLLTKCPWKHTWFKFVWSI